MKLVTKYQISAINSGWEKYDEKWAYMFNVYKNQLSLQTGSRNLTGPKTLPTIWYTYTTLVTKYQISAINSYWEKCDGRTDRGKTVYPPPPLGSRGIKIYRIVYYFKVLALLYLHPWCIICRSEIMSWYFISKQVLCIGWCNVCFFEIVDDKIISLSISSFILI